MVQLLIGAKKILIEITRDKASHFTLSLLKVDKLTLIFANYCRLSLHINLIHLLNVSLNIKWIIFKILISIFVTILKI